MCVCVLMSVHAYTFKLCQMNCEMWNACGRRGVFIHVQFYFISLHLLCIVIIN